MLIKTLRLSLVLVVGLGIGSCGSNSVKIELKRQIIDVIITDNENPTVKEITIGGRSHSDHEMEGNIKVRSTNGYLKVKTLGILGWWTSIDDEKSYEMDRVEKIVYNLRIKDRVKFISDYLDKDYNGSIADDVKKIIDTKINKTNSDVTIRDEIGLFAFAKEDLLSKLTNEIENKICSDSSVAMAKHSAVFDNESILIRIASGHNGITKYKQFYRPEAEKDYLKAVEQFRGILLNNYMGTHFDISKNCPDEFQFNIGNNAKANISLKTPKSKRSILFDKAKNEVFDINATVKSIDFTGGFIPGSQFHEDDFVITTGNGIIRIQNISRDIIKIKSIALFYNKNANESTYQASILPGQYLDFEVEDNKTSKVFSVNNYSGGSIEGGLNIGYDIGGQIINKHIDIKTGEASIWNNLVMSN